MFNSCAAILLQQIDKRFAVTTLSFMSVIRCCRQVYILNVPL